MLVLPAEITHEQAVACCRMLTQGLRSQADAAVVADASGLQRFDSSALAVLLELRREAASLGKTLAISRMPARLRELATLYGVAGLFAAAP